MQVHFGLLLYQWHRSLLQWFYSVSVGALFASRLKKRKKAKGLNLACGKLPFTGGFFYYLKSFNVVLFTTLNSFKSIGDVANIADFDYNRCVANTTRKTQRASYVLATKKFSTGCGKLDSSDEQKVACKSDFLLYLGYGIP